MSVRIRTVWIHREICEHEIETLDGAEFDRIEDELVVVIGFVAPDLRWMPARFLGVAIRFLQKKFVNVDVITLDNMTRGLVVCHHFGMFCFQKEVLCGCETHVMRLAYIQISRVYKLLLVTRYVIKR